MRKQEYAAGEKAAKKKFKKLAEAFQALKKVQQNN